MARHVKVMETTHWQLLYDKYFGDYTIRNRDRHDEAIVIRSVIEALELKEVVERLIRRLLTSGVVGRLLSKVLEYSEASKEHCMPMELILEEASRLGLNPGDVKSMFKIMAKHNLVFEVKPDCFVVLGW